MKGKVRGWVKSFFFSTKTIVQKIEPKQQQAKIPVNLELLYQHSFEYVNSTRNI